MWILRSARKRIFSSGGKVDNSQDTRIELYKRYEKIYAGAITDILDEMHYYNQTIPSEIKPIKLGMRTVGSAFTVVGRPKRQISIDEGIRPILKWQSCVTPHSVVVMQTNSRDIAHIGELGVNSIRKRGCQGIVIDGGVRDVGYILKEEFPVWARYLTAPDAVPRWEVIDWNVPIIVGDVQVRPGDVIVGDYDGVICIPLELAEEVLIRCEEKVERENKVRSALREGVNPTEAYEKFGRY
jgi:4-hydroxy-4-methyl-2-oxoglutarate aldolase